jgi:DNA mismatch repair protein MutS
VIAVLRQAAELKRQHPDTILFFRLGEFYEVFGDDAGLVARELQMTLTSRPSADGDRIAMAGVPVHSTDQALARLLARGHKVAMAEQLTERQTYPPSAPIAAGSSEPATCPRPEPAAQLPLPF